WGSTYRSFWWATRAHRRGSGFARKSFEHLRPVLHSSFVFRWRFCRRESLHYLGSCRSLAVGCPLFIFSVSGRRGLRLRQEDRAGEAERRETRWRGLHREAGARPCCANQPALDVRVLTLYILLDVSSGSRLNNVLYFVYTEGKIFLYTTPTLE
ncbi:unnamed protein product, partial [Hapterophycus canaliculatus]